MRLARCVATVLVLLLLAPWARSAEEDQKVVFGPGEGALAIIMGADKGGLVDEVVVSDSSGKQLATTPWDATLPFIAPRYFLAQGNYDVFIPDGKGPVSVTIEAGKITYLVSGFDLEPTVAGAFSPAVSAAYSSLYQAGAEIAAPVRLNATTDTILISTDPKPPLTDDEGPNVQQAPGESPQ